MWLLVCFGLLILWYAYERRRGIRKMESDAAELARLKSLPNFYRLCRVVDDTGRELICRVREWNIRPEYALSELWCIDPISHPNGWTKSFVWANEDIEFLD
jgi:hypothetical protein